jgi:hypothetical protein
MSIEKKDVPGDVFAIGHRLFRTMSRNMNYSHEMKSEQVRNTFSTLHSPHEDAIDIYKNSMC